jgi:hypothetical protein
MTASNVRVKNRRANPCKPRAVHTCFVATLLAMTKPFDFIIL